jgi:hypothetical protein
MDSSVIIFFDCITLRCICMGEFAKNTTENELNIHTKQNSESYCPLCFVNEM